MDQSTCAWVAKEDNFNKFQRTQWHTGRKRGREDMAGYSCKPIKSNQQLTPNLCPLPRAAASLRSPGAVPLFRAESGLDQRSGKELSVTQNMVEAGML